MATANGLFSFKKNTVGKLLVILFAALLCSVIVLTSSDDSVAEVDDEFIDGDFTYIVTSEDVPLAVKVSKYNGTSKDLTIPPEAIHDEKTYYVTLIGANAFENRSDLKSIIMPTSMRTIESSAFLGCSGLTSIVLDRVITIKENAFLGCSGLTSVTIPNSVTTIGKNAFLGCSGLTSVTFCNDLDYIGNDAFADCKFYSPEDKINPLTQDADTLKGHTYSGLNNNNLVRDVDPFTISFISEENEILSYKMGPGATIILPDYSDTKDPDANFNYVFAWIDYTEGMTVQEDKIFYSYFIEYCTITWIVDGVSPNKTTQVVANEEIPYYGEDPTKVDDVNGNTFKFVNFVDSSNSEPTTVAGPMTYIAQFDEYCVITWIVDEVSTDEKVKVGTTLTPADPTKAPNANGNTYVFTAWSPAVVEAAVNATYTAQFDEYCVITWTMNGVSTDEDVKVGTALTPAVPTKAPNDNGNTYVFTAWSPTVVNAAVNAIYTAGFDEYCVITWTVNGVSTDETVKVGTALDPAVPKKVPNVNGNTYVFTAWSPTVVNAAVNANYTAGFDEYCVITWIVDGVSTDEDVKVGTVLDPADPTKATNDNGNTYVFTAWSPTVVNAAVNANYNAGFDEYCVITWIVDGVSTTEDVKVGTALDPADPTKAPNDNGNTYVFTAWSPAVVEATVNATYTAQFTEYCNISWIIDDSKTILQSVEYGTVPIFDGIPAKDPTAQLTFKFNKWDVKPDVVTGPTTYTAEFFEFIRFHEIKWIVEDVEAPMNVEYGALPIFNGIPTKASTVEFTYNFNKWGVEPVPVIGPATYTAEFNEVVRSYPITWVIDGVEDITSVAYNTVPVYGTPTKLATPQFTYVFDKWNVEPVLVAGPTTYTAEFKEVLRYHDITWIVEGIKIITTEPYGNVPVHGTPTKASTVQFTYVFDKWNVEPVPVTGHATYTAEFNEIIRSYDITWIVEGSEITTKVAYGTMPTFIDMPIKESNDNLMYSFSKWDIEPVAVKDSATYTAVFNEMYIEVPDTDNLKNLIDEDKLVLQVNSIATGTIDNSVFSYLHEEGKSLTINMMNGNNLAYSWTFEGEYNEVESTIFSVGVSETTPYKDLEDAIVSSKINNPLVLNFAASGELSMKALVKYFVGDKYDDGVKLSLFFYNEETKLLEDQVQIVTVTEGYVTFNLTHCSYYVFSELIPDTTVAGNNTMMYVAIVILIAAIISLFVVFVVYPRYRF